ncbi:hypothetical protein AKJ16_DCAP18288 [Drosera capensis]
MVLKIFHIFFALLLISALLLTATDHGRGLSSRKFLVTTTSFDFAPFYRDRRDHEHKYQRGRGVDPRYADEKPLVPTDTNKVWQTARSKRFTVVFNWDGCLYNLAL